MTRLTQIGTLADEIAEKVELIKSLTETPVDVPLPDEPVVVEPEPPIEPPQTPPIVVNPPLSQWIRPDPRPRQDWMAFPTVFAKEIYVSPEGHDNGTGTINDPLLSLEAALLAIRGHATSVNLRLKRGGTYTREGAWWAKSGHYFYTLDKPLLISDYGEGELPVIDFGGLAFEGSTTKQMEAWYYKSLRIKNGGFFIWDKVRYMAWDNVHIEGARLGYNIAAGRGDLDSDNHSFAILNSSQQYCPGGGVFSDASNIYIDNNLAQRNGSGWRDRNYYLCGNNDKRCYDIVLQNSKSIANSPDPVTGGGGASPHWTTHCYCDGLYIPDHEFLEAVQDASHDGCWGIAADEGRVEDWGMEEMRNVNVTGNLVKYTGNQNISISNAVNPLVGWNELHLNTGKVLGCPAKPASRMIIKWLALGWFTTQYIHPPLPRPSALTGLPQPLNIIIL